MDEVGAAQRFGEMGHRLDRIGADGAERLRRAHAHAEVVVAQRLHEGGEGRTRRRPVFLERPHPFAPHRHGRIGQRRAQVRHRFRTDATQCPGGAAGDLRILVGDRPAQLFHGGGRLGPQTAERRRRVAAHKTIPVPNAFASASTSSLTFAPAMRIPPTPRVMTGTRRLAQTAPTMDRDASPRGGEARSGMRHGGG